MLSNIQALRFFAAFAVVLFHSRKLFSELGLQGDVFLYWAQFGSAGVDVFFVISGYVMWLTTCNSPRSVAASGDFLRRRLFRIYLGYWPFYFLAAVVTLTMTGRNPENIYWLDSFFLLNPTIRNQVLGVAWTLSYELYFYVMFAAMILLPRSYHQKLLLVLFAGIVVVNAMTDTHSFSYGFFINYYLIEFFAGCLLAAYLGRNRSRLLLVLCSVMVVVMINYAVTLPRFHMNRIQGFGVASMLIVLAAVLLENTRAYTASRWLVFLGNCSYSLYLGHFILLWVFMYLVKQLQPEVGTVMAALLYLSYPAAAVGLSIVSYRYMEAPLYKYALRNWVHRKAPCAGLER